MSLPITNVGLAIMAKRMITQAGESGSAQPEPKYLAWGTGTTATTLTTTALQTPAAEARTAATTSTVTTNVANDTYQAVGTITSLSAQNISELGQLDASTSGNLLARWVFTALPLNTGDSVTFTTQVYGT